MAALALTILRGGAALPAADSVSVNMPVVADRVVGRVISNFASYLAIVLRVDEVTDLEGDRHHRRDRGPLKQSGAARWVVDLLEGKVLPAMLKRQLQLLLPLVDRFVSVCLSTWAHRRPTRGRRGHTEGVVQSDRP